MLTVNQLRQVAARSGARDIANVEIDVLLTYLLQLFTEKGLMEHLAFKGGTMLRKMVFGPRGRLSTDLDFTHRSDIPIDDLTMMMLDTLAVPYHDIAFGFDRDKDWYVTDDGSSAIPVCAHPENQKGLKIKIQISTREKPILPVCPVAQLEQDYFRLLPFVPAEIPCLTFEEAVAEKIRAASQRTKIRDLHDLSEIGRSAVNHDLIRPLAVLKLWGVGGPGLNYDRLRERVQSTTDYELGDLRNLLRRDQEPDLKAMIDRVCDRFRFLSALTDAERKLAADEIKQHAADAEALLARVRVHAV
jgi:predicted nucleotidyltransferase component of viral defense system